LFLICFDNYTDFAAAAPTGRQTSGITQPPVHAIAVQRILGQSDPQRRWVRLSGSGPVRLSSVLSLLDLYIQGGPFLHPIAVLFAIMVILAVNGLFIYRRGRICPDDFAAAAEQALVRKDLAGFEALAKKTKGLLPVMCRAMMAACS
jgi:hypothetical protein